MKQKLGYEIRETWLNFWKTKGHDIIESAPLVPINDPTLLWINAGVTPLKKYFDGSEIPNNRRMANVQKSLRTNDIENVGKTARHHTFFEMLGNFSIGDYFRDEALVYAMEVLTDPRWFGFDINDLYFTVYPNDQDTIHKWIELGVNPSHIVKVEGNFWEIGEGPCGPDTEIFFDRGEQYDPEKLGVKLIENDINNERYIEIWNIVFSQYNAKTGVPREKYKELPNKNIDTGMGLERMACVIQGVQTNYETDLFMPIINACSQRVKREYHGQMAFKVIADHLRSVVFALSDGATFSNEGRGYVLRRLLRRATRFARTLGMNEAFLYELVAVVIDNMKVFYPYLLEKEDLVTKQIRIEEEKFLLTLESGEKRLLEFIKNASHSMIEKEIAFLLYDTFGFPFELTVEVASEHGFSVDESGFRMLLKEQKERARSARNTTQSMNTQNAAMLSFVLPSSFVGYDILMTQSKVIGLFSSGERVNKASGDVIAVFDVTGFYAESGGQIGDTGHLSFNHKNYSISNTLKLPNGQHGLHIDMREDTLSVGDMVLLAVDENFRNDVAKNHSATHLLNETLRQVLGTHVVQQGSQVTNQFLRFDFNHFVPLTPEELLTIEAHVNREIQKAHDVEIKQMPLTEAKKLNVQAVFGEKYGEVVRVINMDYSKELCGGTHVHNTQEIHQFVILSVETKGSGIYRIEATTHLHIVEELEKVTENIRKESDNSRQKIERILQEAAENHIALTYNEVPTVDMIESYRYVMNCHQELEQLKNVTKELEKEFLKKQREKNQISLESYLSHLQTIQQKSIVIFKEEDKDLTLIKDLVDRLSDYIPESIIFVALINQETVTFVCKNKINKLNAGALVKRAAIATNGNGGGRSDFAQAGGRDITKVEEALSLVMQSIKETL